MDHKITELRRAIERSPDDLALRARLIQARARARDPKLMADFEAVALMLEALAAIAAAHGAFLEEPDDGPAGLIFLLDKFERLQRHWSGLPQAFWDSGRQALEAYLRSRSAVLDRKALALGAATRAAVQESIWDACPGTFGDLLFAAWGVRKTERSSLDLLQNLLDETAATLRHAFREDDRPFWSLELFWLPEFAELDEPRTVAERGLTAFRCSFELGRARRPEVFLRSGPCRFDAEENRRDPDLRLFPKIHRGRWSWDLNPDPPGPFTPLLRHLLSRASGGPWQRWEVAVPQSGLGDLFVNLLRIGQSWYLLKALSEEAVIGFLEGEVEV